VPESEALRIQTAISGQNHQHSVILLPTSVFRNGKIPTNVDLFIVPSRPVCSNESASVDHLGLFVGLRLAQTSVDSSEVSEALAISEKSTTVESGYSSVTSDHSSMHETATKLMGASLRRFNISSEISDEGLRQRRRVSFSDQDSLSDGMSSMSSVISLARRRARTLDKKSLCPKALCPSRAFLLHFRPSQSYLKECALALLDDLAGAINFEFQSCCSWHGNLQTISCWIDEMHGWHTCTETWPQNLAKRQCENCSALISISESDDYCWICNAG